MDQFKKNLNYIAAVLILAALASYFIWPYRKTVPIILGAAGLIALGVYLAMNLSRMREAVQRKAFIYSSNMFLVIILVLGILVLINYIFSKYHHRFDFTQAKLHSLSGQTVKVVKNLEEPVEIKCFFRQDNFNRNKVERLLEIYAYHSNKIKYEFIEPDTNPGMVKRYNVTEDGTTVFEQGGREQRITTFSEEDFTNAVIQLTRETQKTVYFLEGHGESGIDLTEAQGYSLAKEELEKQGYLVEKMTLALPENLGKNISVLIIPGPTKELLPAEKEALAEFIRTGGRVFFMVEPETQTGLEAFLFRYGIELANDLVVDPVSRQLGGDYFMPVVSEYGSHPITENFRYATFFPYARSVEEAEETPEGTTIQIIAKSSPDSWSERQLDQQEIRYNEDLDQSGPVSLAAVVSLDADGKAVQEPEAPEEEAGEDEAETLAEKEPKPSKPKETRLAVFGDADFAANAYYNLSGNGNLFLNTINWLTEEADLISIQPKTSQPRTIHLTPTQGRLIFFVSLIILPAAVLLTGVIIWLRRRSL
jgi:ABC-type uncharacterized transport system involved in gliding motility auxiliary subunit